METIKILENKILVRKNGAPKKALILIHGRGATAENIMSVAFEIKNSNDTIFLAPQSSLPFWYPEVFTESKNKNEPYLSESLNLIKELFIYLKKEYSIEIENIALFGFSQGACLVSEYIKQNPQRYLGAGISSGGLIGTDEEILLDIQKESNIQNTPIYIGVDENDPYINLGRVQNTAKILTDMNAKVSLNIYKDLGHSVHRDAINFLENILIRN